MSGMSDFASGSVVTLRGLVKAPELNRRTGIILRKDRDAGRLIVYLRSLPGAGAKGLMRPVRLVRIRPANLVATSPEFDVARVATPPLFPPRAIAKLQMNRVGLVRGDSVVPFYYAFGNTFPTYLFLGVPANQENVRVLSLGNGDIRSQLYSLARDTPERCSPVKRSVSFVVNDICVSVIARNLVFVWLIHSGASVEAVFGIWYSLKIDDLAYAALCDAVLALTGPNAKEELASICVQFHSQLDWERVRAVLLRWLHWQDGLDWKTVTAMRQNALREHLGADLEANFRNVAKAYFADHELTGDPGFPIEKATEEFVAAGITGIVQVSILHSGEYSLFCVNPTLFYQPDRYTLHYGSVAFTGFPKFAARYDLESPLKTKCLQEFQRWVNALKSHGDRVSWVFSTEDCTVYALETAPGFECCCYFECIRSCRIASAASVLAGLCRSDRTSSHSNLALAGIQQDHS